MTDAYEYLDASYVLGALESDERREYEAHLRECPRCAASVAEMAGLPTLLALVPPADIDFEMATPAAPASLLPTLVRTLRRRRRNRRIAVVAGSLAAAASLIVVTTLAVRTSNTPAQPQAVAMTPLVPGKVVNATLRLSKESWGTRIDVQCSYRDFLANGSPPNVWYALWVVSRTGAAEQVGTWKVTSPDPVSATGTTLLSRSQISSVEIRTFAGLPLLRFNQ
jgi:anti-sigma factor RsiW